MRQDIDPRKWGPSLWVSIHSMAAAYEPEEVPEQEVVNFMKSLAHLLPCSKCREHWVTLMQDFPVTEWLQSRDTFFTWTLKVRDMVTANSSRGPSKPLDYNLMRNKYNIPVQKQTPAVTGRQARQLMQRTPAPPAQQPKVVAQPPVTSAGRSTRGLVGSRTVAPSSFSRGVNVPKAVKPVKLTAARSAAYNNAIAKFVSQKEKKGCKSCGRRR